MDLVVCVDNIYLHQAHVVFFRHIPNHWLWFKDLVQDQPVASTVSEPKKFYAKYFVRFDLGQEFLQLWTLEFASNVASLQILIFAMNIEDDYTALQQRTSQFSTFLKL